MVEVTAAGNTVSTVVFERSAFPDPTTDTVTGTTASGRTVEILVESTRTDCDYESNWTTTTSDGNGDFSASFGPGFDRSVDVTVGVYDDNGNYSYTYFYPPHIALDDDGRPSGYLKPDVSYTVALLRGETTVSTFSGTTTERGRYSGWFTETVEAGDVISVSGGGQAISTTFVALNDVSFDPGDDLISGTLGSEGASRSVKVELQRSLEHGCTYERGCVTATTDISGDFSLDFSSVFDMQRGDEDYGPTIYDAEGNRQEFRGALVVPVIEVVLQDDALRGSWREPSVVVTATLQDSGGTVKSVDTDTTSSYDADFWTFFSMGSIESGDRIDVTDGAYTLTVASVPTLTTYLDASSDEAYVNGTAGRTWVTLFYDRHFDPTYGEIWYVHCYTHTGSVLSFGTNIDVTAQNTIYTYETDPDGHSIAAYSHAFAIDAEKDGHLVRGYVPAPNTPVTITLLRVGQGAMDTITTTADGYGQYDGVLTSATITQGDTVQVDNGTIVEALSVPHLTVEEDAAHDQVTGEAPANAVVEVDLYPPFQSWSNWIVQTTADADGYYVADFDGVYSSWDCTEAEVGACTQPQATYYNDDGHTVSVWGPEPTNVLADAFEPDGAYTTATAYTGSQSHTFHVFTDTDWISFTVGSDDLGLPYYLKTTNLGINANTRLYLYHMDGSILVELTRDTSYSPAASEIAWTPSVSGTYYVKVVPYHPYEHTEDCGSTYDFLISHRRVYLPLKLRSH